MRRAWQPREVTYLKRHYAHCGPHHCAQTLNRSYWSVVKKAWRLGLDSGMVGVDKLVPLAWVAPQRNRPENYCKTAYRKAETDGVIHRVPGRRVKIHVPQWWADQYARERADEWAREKATRAWLRSTDIAEMVGVQRSTLTENIHRNHGVAKFLNGVEHVFVPPGEHRWHPVQGRAAIRRYLEARS